MDNIIKEVEFKEALNIVLNYVRQQENEIAKEQLRIFGLATNINDGAALAKSKEKIIKSVLRSSIVDVVLLETIAQMLYAS